MDQFTIIGTTDREYTGDPAKVSITEQETDYLLNVVNAHFKQQVSRADILRTYSGVRPLCNDESDNPSAVTVTTPWHCPACRAKHLCCRCLVAS